MKVSSITVVLMFGATLFDCQAFSLDAAGYEGGELERYPMAVRVPGYGEVVLEADIGAALVVNPGYSNRGDGDQGLLSFDARDAVEVAFAGPVEGIPEVAGVGDGTGTRPNGWDVIPKPSTAGLGIVGILALLLAHRR